MHPLLNGDCSLSVGVGVGNVRLLEVMIEAARLLGHEPRHIHELESLDVLNLPNSALLPTAPVDAVFLTPTQIAEANAVDGAPGYMVCCLLHPADCAVRWSPS